MPATSRPLPQTFVLYEHQVRVVDHLKAFRRIATILADHLPAVQDGDTVMMRVASQHMIGDAVVLSHTHVATASGQKTALAIQLKEKE